MTIQDKFDAPIAYNPTGGDEGEGVLVPSSEFQVYAVDDVSFTTPLAVTDPSSGVTISPLRSSSIGVLPDFRVAGDPSEVVLKSGSFVTVLMSRFGIFTEAGWDPVLAADAVAAAGVAEAARDAAVVAQEAAEAVPLSNDGIVESLIQDPDSATAGALSATIATPFQSGSRAMGERRLARVVGDLSEVARGVTVGALVTEATASTASLGAVTITASDDLLTTASAHGLIVNDVIVLFGHTGSNLSSATRYYVESAPTATTFKVRGSTSGAATNITADGSATALYRRERGYDRDAAQVNPLFRVLNTAAVQADPSHPARDYIWPDQAAVTYAPGTAIGNFLTVEVEVEGTQYLDIVVRRSFGGTFRIWVDGLLADTIVEADYTGAGVGSDAVARIPLTLSDTRRRVIRFEGAVARQQLVAFDVGVAGRLAYPVGASPKGPKVLLVSDSFMDGASSGGSANSQDVAWWLSKLMDWPDARRSASGGTGYFVDGARQSLVNRYENDIIDEAPDQVLIALGVNEHTSTLSSVVNAATTVWDAILTDLPLTQLTIVGPWPTNGGVGTQPSTILALDAALREEAETRGLQYISPIDGGVTFGLVDTIHADPDGHRTLATYIAGQMLMPSPV